MMGDLGPKHTVNIDGSPFTFQRHICGVRAGTIHTTVGDFADLEELGRYVRGRNGTEDPSRGQTDGPDSRLEFWPGLYYLPE